MVPGFHLGPPSHVLYPTHGSCVLWHSHSLFILCCGSGDSGGGQEGNTPPPMDFLDGSFSKGKSRAEVSASVAHGGSFASRARGRTKRTSRWIRKQRRREWDPRQIGCAWKRKRRRVDGRWESEAVGTDGTALPRGQVACVNPHVWHVEGSCPTCPPNERLPRRKRTAMQGRRRVVVQNQAREKPKGSQHQGHIPRRIMHPSVRRRKPGSPLHPPSHPKRNEEGMQPMQVPKT